MGGTRSSWEQRQRCCASWRYSRRRCPHAEPRPWSRWKHYAGSEAGWELDFSPVAKRSFLRDGLKSLRSSPRIREGREAHRRSLHYAPPDFLLNSMALVHFMRLSLTERRTRGPVQCSVAGNPGTLRSG